MPRPGPELRGGRVLPGSGEGRPVRVGLGYDSHRFDPGRPLVLGGVEIPGEPGLSGHSDGDAVVHALIDALLGATGSGDVGRHFPPDDPRWEGADSMDLLERTMTLLRDGGWRVVNVDATVICERPKIGPVAAGMGKRLGEVLGVAPEAVSIKGKSNEGMGWIGAGEGLAVHCVALVAKAGGGGG